MGQGKSTHYISLRQHLLKTHGAKVSVSDLEQCLSILESHNPWFPDEGTLDSESWTRIRENVEKAVRQGEKFL